ncbi:MAG TPA: glycosyltransferase family A protein [Urbifossiella sp.]|nr:glycosyltransferase family A protein [Urbifossiella sp.]
MLQPDPGGPRDRRAVCEVVDPDRLTGPGFPDDRPLCLLLTAPASFPVPPGAAVRPVLPAHVPPEYRVKNLYEPSAADGSDRVRGALLALDGEFGFGRVVFPSHGGFGFRAVQAKRAGLAFAGTTLVVRFDGAGQLDREAGQRWAGTLDELERDFLERFAFENADEVIDPAGAAAALGWRWTAPPPEPPSATALVTIGIAHYNLGAHLPATLASVAAQTYPALDVVVIDDGSTDPASRDVFDRMEREYPRFRFVRQANAGIGATRNRCLEFARGEFFLPMDADNVARPEMVERFVTALRRNPQYAAMSCYFLAFDERHGEPAGDYLFALRPVGGPHAMAAIRNVYGDANSIFRTDTFRAAGGYGTDRGTSCEDWEAFVKLVQAGGRIGVVPDHLFYYRHRADGFSRVTNWYANHQRVLRQFARADHLPPGEAAVLWAALLGFQQEAARLADRQRAWRYRVADGIAGALRWLIPGRAS